jgi:hypothetical protein
LDGLSEYAVAKKVIEAALRYDLHAAAQKLLKIGD